MSNGAPSSDAATVPPRDGESAPASGVRTTASDAAPKSPWLVSPLVDLMLGAGGIYVVIALVLTFVGSAQVLDTTTAACLALLIGGPHYGATLIRGYGTPEARAQFRTIGTYATIALVVAVLTALWVPIVGALLVTLYFTWVAYHYAAQSYGVTRMFLARRSIPIDDRSRRALQTMFTTSALLWIVSIHTELPTREAVAPTELYPLLRLGIPLVVGNALLVILAAVMLGCLGYAALHLVRTKSIERAYPAILLTLGQMMWFAVPVLTIRTGLLGGLVPFALDTRTTMFLFIALTHASQHLWVALYHAKKQNGGTDTTHFLRSLAAGSLVWALPAVLLPFGPVPSEMGVAILVAAAVNVHHFALDGVVWKLRDPKNASLVRNVASGTSERSGQLLLGLGTVALAVQFLGIVVDREVSSLTVAPDRDRLALIEPLAKAIGRDGPSLRTARLVSEVAAGECDEASRTLSDVPPTWSIPSEVRARVESCGSSRELSLALPSH